MKGLKFLLLGMTICLASGVRAQFNSSERVYCYKYVKTVNDGISSKLNKTMFYFVNFQNEMMGYTTESNLQRVRQNLLEDPDYYKDRAIDDLASNYNKYKNRPTYGTATMGPGQGSVWLIKYCSEYTTSSKYTYREMKANAQNADGGLMYNPVWGKMNWQSKCYSFSRDRSELIIWRTSDSENRDYYKLVDVESLKPNTDFLE